MDGKLVDRRNNGPREADAAAEVEANDWELGNVVGAAICPFFAFAGPMYMSEVW